MNLLDLVHLHKLRVEIHYTGDVDVTQWEARAPELVDPSTRKSLVGSGDTPNAALRNLSSHVEANELLLLKSGTNNLRINVPPFEPIPGITPPAPPLIFPYPTPPPGYAYRGPNLPGQSPVTCQAGDGIAAPVHRGESGSATPAESDDVTLCCTNCGYRPGGDAYDDRLVEGSRCANCDTGYLQTSSIGHTPARDPGILYCVNCGYIPTGDDDTLEGARCTNCDIGSFKRSIGFP